MPGHLGKAKCTAALLGWGPPVGLLQSSLAVASTQACWEVAATAAAAALPGSPLDVQHLDCPKPY